MVRKSPVAYVGMGRNVTRKFIGIWEYVKVIFIFIFTNPSYYLGEYHCKGFLNNIDARMISLRYEDSCTVYRPE